MTEPQQEDLTAEADDQVRPTGNGLQPGDPDDQPSQSPHWLPDGTETDSQ